MTDETRAPAEETLIPGNDTPLAAPAAESTPDNRAKAAMVGLAVLALLVVVGGFLLWQRGNTALAAAAQAQAQLDAVNGRIARLEARPAPAPAPNLQPIEQRLTSLEAKPAVNLQPIEQRMTALETKPAPEAQLDQAGQKQLATLSGRIDGIAARQDQLGTQEQADLGKVGAQITAADQKTTAQLAAMEQKVAAAVAAGSAVAARADKAGTDVAALTQNETRTARLQAASVALAAGRPLGDVPGAPPALAQFASKPPPTEASLRLSYGAAANAALEAGQPAKDGTPFWSRVWSRAQSGLVVRQGDRVLVGDVVTGVVEHARHLLDAGDLAGAVSELNGLAGPAAAAMAPWRAQAQSLLDARAALLTAAHG